jgi:hypothetical protein
MATPIRIHGRNGLIAEVTPSGELVTAPKAYSDSVFREMSSTGTAYNFYSAMPRKQFIITGFNIKADRNVSNTVDASVIIYEADDEDTTTVSRVVFQESMIRGERTGYTNTNIKINPGKWLSAKTTDATIYMTVFGYYIDQVDK